MRLIFSVFLLQFKIVSIFGQQKNNSVDDYIYTEKKLLFDSSRMRKVPLVIYQPKLSLPNQSLVILSHGYGFNRGDSYLGYSYIGDFLASKGYFVVSIQYELSDDDSLPMKGNLQELRLPNWRRGVQSIEFVLNELKGSYPNLNTNQIILIGHSNGGDISMLFTHSYPERVSKVISLDNRRVSLPKVSSPCIYSLRSCDQQPDEGVLPTLEEQHQNNITIIQLENTIHNEMANNASKSKKEEILKYIWGFLNE